MTLYAGTILLTELLMAAMIVHVARYAGFTKGQRLWFLLTFCAVMVCAGAEFLAKCLDGASAQLRLPLTVITVVQFGLAPFLPVFFAGALGMRDLARKAAPFFAAHAVFEVVVAPLGLVFFFDAAGRYCHGPLYAVYQATFILGLVLLIACLALVGRKFSARDGATVAMVLVVMAAALVPMLAFGVYTDYVGVGMCACLCYIYYNDLVQQEIQADLAERQAQVSRMQGHIITSMANLIESRDGETGGHVARTSAYVRALARAAREDGVYADELDDEYIQLLHSLAALHDIGKIVVPDQILKKPGPLTDEEFAQMKLHAAAGGSIVREILGEIASEEMVQVAADIATYHHERWDGTGYPEGLRGEEIPLCARIMAVADVYDALTSERSYKKAMPAGEALALICSEQGTHFDPQLVKVLRRHFYEIAAPEKGEDED